MMVMIKIKTGIEHLHASEGDRNTWVANALLSNTWEMVMCFVGCTIDPEHSAGTCLYRSITWTAVKTSLPVPD